MAEHEAFWIATSDATSYPALSADIDVDVAIIGGGIVGIMAAKQLKASGKTVAVLEARRIAEGVTGNTTAKVTSLHSLIYHTLISTFGEEKARLYGEANQAAIALIGATCRDNGLDCELREASAYTYAVSDDQLPMIEKEADAAQRLGLPAAFYDELPLPFAVKGAVGFSGQLQFHPRKFLLPLAAGIPGGGSHIFEQSRVVDVDADVPIRVLTAGGFTVTAQDVIVATNMPILNKGMFFSRAEPQRGYALAMHVPSERAPDGMFINAEAPTHSVRTAPYRDGTVLILAGEGHPVAEADGHRQQWEKLEQWGRSQLGATGVAHRWSTQDYYSIDQVPFIGTMQRGSEHLFTATGFSAWGMTHGVVAGVLLADLITGRENPWAELYDPHRTNLKTVASFVKKGGKDAKRFTADRLKDGLDAEQISEVAPGAGRIVDVDGEKLAVYRDEDGTVQAVSAVCTHMGCIVHYNDAERSWDCPCHGSRFQPDGEVLQGPAIAPLENRREILAERRSS